MNIKNKRAQLAIWVIMALFIVGSIFALTTLSKDPIIPSDYSELNFQSKIEKCIKDSVIESIDIMLPQGGFLDPTDYITYKNTNITFICKNVGNFKTCINQHPMLINEESKEILNYTSPRTMSCLEIAKKEFEKRDYQFNITETKINITLAPSKVFVDLDNKIVISKNGKSSEFKGIHVSIDSPIYDLSQVAIEIANQEAKYCYFEYVGYMILYQRFGIEKFVFSDSTKIYTIKDKYSDKLINIATRSCVIPGGL